MSQRFYSARPSFGSTLVGLLVFILIVYGLFRLAVFTLDTLLTGLPIFFALGVLLGLGSWFVDKRVPVDFLRWVGSLVRQNPLRGILTGAATVLFAPFVGGYLLAKSLLLKKVKTAVGDFQERSQEHMRQQAGMHEPGSRTGEGFTEVRRDDGMVIRIPSKD